MKLWMNLLVQIISVVVSSAAVISAAVPAKYKGVVVVVVSLLQGTTSYFAHQYNPDGSKAPEATATHVKM